MASVFESATQIYLASDLLPAGRMLPRNYQHTGCEYVAVTRTATDWVVESVTDARAYYGQSTLTRLVSEPTAGEVREIARRCSTAIYPAPAPIGWTPIQSAEPIARRWARRVRLSPTELLADARFRAEARRVAEKDKTFSALLLEWEKKDVVRAAVAIVRAEVDAERAEAARLAAIAAAERKARADQEAPARKVVLTAYAACGYRTCTQGHDTYVMVGGRLNGTPAYDPMYVGVQAEKERGGRYSSRCTFSRMTSAHTLYVRADYLDRVFAGHTFDGGVVLDAAPVGVTGYATPVYDLRVVRQASGTALRVETVRVTVADGAWAPLAKRDAAKAVPMPAPILADYLEDRGVPTEDVMPLRAGYAS